MLRRKKQQKGSSIYQDEFRIIIDRAKSWISGFNGLKHEIEIT